MPPVDPTNMRRWAPAVVAVVAFAGVAGWGALARGTSGGGSATTSPTDAAQPVSASVTPVETTVPASTTTVVQRPLPRELVKGATGEDVKMVQQRLYDIGFDPGGVDGVYGTSTIQAVWAFEKLVLGTPPDKVTGQVTPAMWQRMEQPLGVQPLRPNGSPTHVEVYLPQQVLVVFRDNQPILISHISTGSNQDWCEVVKVDNDDGTQTEKGICGKSITPGGVFSFNRRRAGWREGELGRMWNPVYFNYGIAVHGAGNVPELPRIARLRPHPHAHRQLLPQPGEVRRPGLRVRRGQGAGGLRRPGPAVQHPRPELHDHDVVHHDDHDGRPHHQAGSDAGADHPGASAADGAPDHAGARQHGRAGQRSGWRAGAVHALRPRPRLPAVHGAG